MADAAYTDFRVCTKCGIKKPATFKFFDNYRDRGKVRQRVFCRVCLNAKTREYRKNNPEKARRWEANNARRNRAPGSDYQKRRYARLDKEAAKIKLDQWRKENPDKVRAAQLARNERIKERRKSDPEFRAKLNKKSSDWQKRKRQSDPAYRAEALAKNKIWRDKNREYQRIQGNKKRARLKDDPAFRIMQSIRARTNSALKGASKSKTTAELIGAPLHVVKKHIESQFQQGMTWENWGRGWKGAKEWHLDHIRPLSSFDLTDPDQLSQACHYTNLQPLWAKDNLKKGAKLV